MHAHQSTHALGPRIPVLLVEDESLVSDYVEDILEGTRFEVVGVARAASDAVDLADRTHPRLAIVDLTLQTDLDGLEAARLLHERFETTVILVTGSAGAEARARGLIPHLPKLLLKPFLPRQLLTVLDAAATNATS
jgi:DNA-binding response OmpR family regulator